MPDSPSLKDLVGCVEAVDVAVEWKVTFSVEKLEGKLPVDVMEDDNVELGHPVVVETEADPDDEERLVELEEDIGRTVPDSSSVEDLVDTLDVAPDVLRVDVTSDENE